MLKYIVIVLIILELILLIGFFKFLVYGIMRELEFFIWDYVFLSNY